MPDIAYRIMVVSERDPETGDVERTLLLNCPNFEAEERLSLEIIKGRYSGDHPFYSFPKPEPPPVCPFKRADLEAIADEGEREAAQKMVEESAELHGEYLNRLRTWEAVQKAIQTDDKTLAHHLLRDSLGGYETTYVYGGYFLPKK